MPPDNFASAFKNAILQCTLQPVRSKLDVSRSFHCHDLCTPCGTCWRCYNAINDQLDVGPFQCVLDCRAGNFIGKFQLHALEKDYCRHSSIATQFRFFAFGSCIQSHRNWFDRHGFELVDGNCVCHRHCGHYYLDRYHPQSRERWLQIITAGVSSWK